MMEKFLVALAFGIGAVIPLRALADDGASSSQPRRLTEVELEEVTAGALLPIVIPPGVIPTGPGPHFLWSPHATIDPPPLSPAGQITPMVRNIQLTFDVGPADAPAALQPVLLSQTMQTSAATALQSGK